MADFKVLVQRIRVTPHHNADALEIACIGDYRSIVQKGVFRTDDLVAYIPEQALLPEWLIEEMGLTGRLAGAQKNRVKAIKLRKIFSQGLCYPCRDHWNEGDDVAQELGIIKWEPPVPAHMSGELFSAGPHRTIKYDIENIKKHKHTFVIGEPVVITEKIHGTWCQIGILSDDMAHKTHGQLCVASKGIAARGLAFKPDAGKNKNNLYLRVAKRLDLVQRFRDVYYNGGPIQKSWFIIGEVFGAGVQDLAYGASTGTDESLGFRVFDIYTGQPGLGKFVNDSILDDMCYELDLERVPIIYRGLYGREIVDACTSGHETVSGNEMHIREGVVIRPQIERRTDELGRVQLKSVSEKYLLRKKGTEFN